MSFIELTESTKKQTHIGRHTLRSLQKLYLSGERLTMLTAYDYITAGILDQAQIEMLLVGDSLGNVVLGYETTIPVTLQDMIHHTAAVVRGTRNAFVICDLPFGVASDPESALKASIEVFQKTGCQAVKIEGGLAAVKTVERLVSQGIPVMAHIGLTPQFVHQMGGYYKHGKTHSEIEVLKEAAVALERAGAFAIVLECVHEQVAIEITKMLGIPTIGIGSGKGCAGEVLVTNDLIGLSLKPPPSFAKPRANVAHIIREAALAYLGTVKSKESDEAQNVQRQTPSSH